MITNNTLLRVYKLFGILHKMIEDEGKKISVINDLYRVCTLLSLAHV